MQRSLPSLASDIANAPTCYAAWKRVFRALHRADLDGQATGDWTAFQAIATPLVAAYETADFGGERQVDDQLSKWRALNA